MKFDIFLSICQTEVDGELPDEKKMFDNFFDQVRFADELGFETAWIAETHLSTEVQKKNRRPVVPHFKGEIGLNTDIFQMAHKIFSMTKNMNVGSAIRNILCNGGPIALAESAQTFLSLHQYNAAGVEETRKLRLGFASGRFDFSIAPYGFKPRNETEQIAWPVVKTKILYQATEIFLRLLNGEQLSSENLAPLILEQDDFRDQDQWLKALGCYRQDTGLQTDRIALASHWDFEKVGVIPKEAPQDCLDLILGSHDPKLQIMANKYRPVSVFNLSITPPKVIDETHERMRQHFHKDGGPWKRDYMPRTAMVFISDDPELSAEQNSQKAKGAAQSAWENYWKAMDGTIDPDKVAKAVENTLSGDPNGLAEKIKDKYHPEDRLMLWFDFNNHNNEEIKNSMQVFTEKVAPLING